MKIHLQEYRKKVEGCWMGKNIGGTLGAPFECKRGVFDVHFYTQELGGEPLPNDDLDLQLVWLNAIEKHGRHVTASILGEYWHSYIPPNWGEYGAGKNNMRMGLVPPLSGYVNNNFRDSCGSFILSEIWACICPGHPEIAVRYAYEDAIVDHSNEGVYGEVFCAALESAAFAENDKFKLIDIGLSYIPDHCGIAKGVHSVLTSYKEKKTWQEARIALLNAVPGSFGMLTGYEDRPVEPDVPFGEMGYDAASNIGIMIIGWLYGEDDFGKSICIATNCGEDADCTAGTLGAILGIIGGIDSIPEYWKEPLGNNIKTLSINLGDRGIVIPKTILEMTERVIRVTPLFLGSDLCDCVTTTNGYTVEMLESDQLFDFPKRVNAFETRTFKETLSRCPFTTTHDFTIFKAELDYCGEPVIREEEPRDFVLTIENTQFVQQWVTVKWHVPEGWTVSPSKFISSSLEQYHCNIGKTKLAFSITGTNFTEPRYDLIVEITSVGRHTKGLIPVVLLNSFNG